MIEYAKSFNQRRFVAVLMFFLAWGLIVAGRLVHFQFVLHSDLSDRGGNPYELSKPIPVPRGNILDSGMNVLAASVAAKRIVAEPWKIEKIPSAVEKLAPLLEIDPGVLMKKMGDPAYSKYLILKRKADPNQVARIQAFGIKGIYFEDESARTYPNGDLASPMLGYMDGEGVGVAGLERQYNDDLGGKPGRAIYQVDASGRSYGEKIVKPPVPSHSIILSINNYIQHLVESELKLGIEKAHAAAGVAIVMESQTGRILALASFPGFNGNAYGKYGDNELRNRAVQDQFEAGSVLKIVVAGGCLETGLIRSGEVIDCEMGRTTVGGHVFHDHKPLGLLTFEQFLEQSSNVAAIKLGLRLGEGRLREWLHSFGFGARTGIDLAAEAVGQLHEKQKWSPLLLATVSFGQGISVTSVQILTAINVTATGGYKVHPTIVDRVVDERGAAIRERKTERVRILRPENAAVLMNALEGVVLRGTGSEASLDGYRSAGKTGTAQKADGKHFSKSKYMASFIGFAPLPKPCITILVQIDEPKGAIYGGDVAAPVFRKIAQKTLLRLQVPKDKNLQKGIVASASHPEGLQ
jgi:cell division protein FtsI (penicillin-binding protein 3)